MSHRKFYIQASRDAHDAHNWWLYAQPWLFTNTPMDKKYELDEQRDLPDYRFIKDYFLTVYGPDYVYVDVGANIGLSSLGLAKSGVTTIAFEPVKENIRLLDRSIIENGVLDRLTLYPVALGATAARAEIFVPVNADNSSLNRQIAVMNMKDKRSTNELVQVCSFDSLLRDDPYHNMLPSLHARIRLLKIDVQGFEMEVLQGMSRFLKDCATGTSLLIELDDKLLAPNGQSSVKIIRLMEAMGFSTHPSLSSLDKIFVKKIQNET